MADQFETVMMKHGEHGIQAILENWESYHRVRHSQILTLEERWEHFIRATDVPYAA